MNNINSVAFTIRARENLLLEGQCKAIRRVAANNVYPCEMQKTQKFACLFRHYAKHKGLKKEG